MNYYISKKATRDTIGNKSESGAAAIALFSKHQ
jgi:hypothetical protein